MQHIEAAAKAYPPFSCFQILHGLVIAMAKFQLDRMTTDKVIAIFLESWLQGSLLVHVVSSSHSISI